MYTMSLPLSGYRRVLLAIRGAGDLPGAIAFEVGQPQMRAGGREGDEPEDDVPVVWHPREAAHPWCDVEAQPLQPSGWRAARHRNHPELPPPFGVVPFADRQDAQGSAVMGERQRTLDESPIRKRRVHGRRRLDGLARPGRHARAGSRRYSASELTTSAWLSSRRNARVRPSGEMAPRAALSTTTCGLPPPTRTDQIASRSWARDT